MRKLRDWQAILLLGIAVAVFFIGILTQRAFFWDDVLTQTYPFRAFAATALAKGELPLWNPYAFGGMPFQADIQSAVFYLPNLFLTLFVSHGQLPFYALEVMIVAHFWLAGIGMYYLAKELGLESPFALFSGLVFSLSGFLIVHAVHPVFVEEVAWLPLIAFLFHRAMRRRSIGYAAGAGLLFGHAVLAGAPQISLYIGFFLELFFLFLFAIEAREGGLRRAAGTIPLVAVTFLIAIGIAAIQLLPTLELIPQSDRAIFTFAAAQQYRLQWSQLLSAIVPKFMGADGARETTFWGSTDYGAYWETCFYMGIPALLAIAASLSLIRRNRYVAFGAGVIVLALLLAVGDQFFLHGFFFRFVPGFSRFRGPARVVLFATLCGATLAGFGARALLDLAARAPRKLELGVAVAVAIVAIVCTAIWMGISVPAVAEPMHGRMLAYVGEKALWAMGTAMVCGGIALLLTRRLIGAPVALGLLLAVQYADVLQFGFDQNNGRTSLDQYYAKGRARLTPLVADTTQEPFRIVTREGPWVMMDRNQGMVEHVFQLEGYNVLALRRRLPPASSLSQSYDLMNAKYRVVVDTTTRRMALAEFPSFLPRAWLVEDARVMDSTAVETFMRSDSFDARRMVALEESLPMPLARSAVSPIRAQHISRYRPNSIDVQVAAPRPAVLVLSEVFYPGWQAYIDGDATRVRRANGTLRAVPIPAGSHQVTFRFEPAPLHRGAIISLLTLVVAIALIAWSTLSLTGVSAEAPNGMSG